MLFDTDILIWIERGNEKAARLVDKAQKRLISIQTYMELMQCAKNKRQHSCVKDYLTTLDFEILPLTENIGHRASIYVEEYALSGGMRAGDAIIAATAVEFNHTLTSSNKKHFKLINELCFNAFKP